MNEEDSASQGVMRIDLQREKKGTVILILFSFHAVVIITQQLLRLWKLWIQESVN